MAQPVTLTGVDAVIKAIAKKKATAKVKIHTGLVKAAYVVLSKAKYYCPVSEEGSIINGVRRPPGSLKDSGQVTSVERAGFGSEARVVFGGLAAPYALWVHEHVWKKHAAPTCAKFLERAARETRGVTKQMVQRELTIGTRRYIEGEEVPEIYRAGT